MKVQDKVLLKLEEMKRYITELEDTIPDEDTYHQNRVVRRACEKTIELAIEMVIDIISLLVSSQRLGLPQSEDDLIDILIRKKVLSGELGARIHNLKGFRNILVHRYGQVDDSKSYLFLTQELGDFTRFEQEIKKYIYK